MTVIRVIRLLEIIILFHSKHMPVELSKKSQMLSILRVRHKENRVGQQQEDRGKHNYFRCHVVAVR